MDRETELELIEELLSLKKCKSFFLDDNVTHNPVSHYISEQRFALEREKIFSKTPLIAAHSSELARQGDFLRREIAGRSVLLTRDKSNTVHAFLNICRHRGTQLVNEDAGCQHRFTCPYHAWTYSNSGELIAAPHFEVGFEGQSKTDLGLRPLHCREQFGFIWVTAEEDDSIEFNAHIDALGAELEALNLSDMYVVHQDVHVHDANWKILVEGGLEAYHFKVAHKTTIGPYFEDNLSSYRMLGPHIRSILMRTSMATLIPEDRDIWRLRDNAQILYTLFPNTALLVQQDHIAWINQEALSARQTRVRLSTLAPKSESHRSDHWKRNHEITIETLNEDFVIGESIQAGFASGANETMLFSRFEGALCAFNRKIEQYLKTDNV